MCPHAPPPTNSLYFLVYDRSHTSPKVYYGGSETLSFQYMVSWAHSVQSAAKRHLDRLIHFCTVDTQTGRLTSTQTDHATLSAAIAHICELKRLKLNPNFPLPLLTRSINKKCTNYFSSCCVLKSRNALQRASSASPDQWFRRPCICQSTATRSPVLTRGGICVPPTVTYLPYRVTGSTLTAVGRSQLLAR